MSTKQTIFTDSHHQVSYFVSIVLCCLFVCVHPPKHPVLSSSLWKPILPERKNWFSFYNKMWPNLRLSMTRAYIVSYLMGSISMSILLYLATLLNSLISNIDDINTNLTGLHRQLQQIEALSMREINTTKRIQTKE
jgi:hypothetical protein